MRLFPLLFAAGLMAQGPGDVLVFAMRTESGTTVVDPIARIRRDAGGESFYAEPLSLVRPTDEDYEVFEKTHYALGSRMSAYGGGERLG